MVKEKQYEIGDLVKVISPGQLWSGLSGGRCPLNGRLEFPFIASILNIVPGSDYLSLNIGEYGFSSREAKIEIITTCTNKSYELWV